MPYTKKDYPNTMKNLDEITRLKAIDILNAMLKDGYEEENAIPISIASAKKWKENASKKEMDDLKKKDITKHQKSPSSSAHLQDADVEVFFDPRKEMWAVRSVGAKTAASLHKTKKEALDEARHTVKNRDSKLIKYSKDGKKQK